MRFTLISNIKQDKAMRLILSCFLVFVVLFLVFDIVVKYNSFGIFADKISVTLFGNEEEYIDPITKSAFLEFWHTEIFFIMMLLITLSAVFVRVAKKWVLSTLNTLMISAIVSLCALALAFFMSKAFINIYVATFFLWHGAALYMSFYSLWKLYDKSV